MEGCDRHSEHFKILRQDVCVDFSLSCESPLTIAVLLLLSDLTKPLMVTGIHNKNRLLQISKWLVSCLPIPAMSNHLKSSNLIFLQISQVFLFCFGKRHGSYLSGLYIFIKLLYCINIISQFFILNSFMGNWYSLFGFKLLSGLYHTRTWAESPYFPKVTSKMACVLGTGVREGSFTVSANLRGLFRVI